MEFSAGTHHRHRPINFHWYANWQEDSEANKVANEIAQTPEKYLLSREQLYAAEGGTGGLALQFLVVTLGIGSIFASSPRMSHWFRTGAFTWQEWLCVGGTAVAGNAIGTYASSSLLGDRAAYRNHCTAYYFVKSCNRWEGRKILKNAPMMY